MELIAQSYVLKETPKPKEKPYNTSDVIRLLEEKGIGRPSTYSTILSRLEERGYVTLAPSNSSSNSSEGSWPPREVKSTQWVGKPHEKDVVISQDSRVEMLHVQGYRVTDLGTAVNEWMRGHFESLLHTDFTRELEKRLDEVAEGKLDYWKVVTDFYHNLRPKVDAIPPPLLLGSAAAAVTCSEMPAAAQKQMGEYKGQPIIVKKGRFGYYAQWADLKIKLTETEKRDLNKIIAKIDASQKGFVRTINAKVSVRSRDGKSSFYVMLKKKGGNHAPSFKSLPLGMDPATISLQECMALFV
jgi:reverse gyrase